MASSFDRFTTSLGALSLLRQFGVYVGLAGALAAAVAVFMWAREPAYTLLYGSLSEKDVAEVMAALQESGVGYRIDDRTGAVLVPGNKVHEVRFKLASRGLPRGTGTGYELLDQEKAFGTSRFSEAARHQRALEGELARSIATISHIQAARVHLATPKDSVFVRQRAKPSASVIVSLYAGRTLDKAQVESIAHLVAASVPSLEASEVRVIDQKGNLLSGRSGQGFALTASQFEYTRQIEESYVTRILDLVAPIVGAEAVRAQVTADLDFTVTERTEESFGSETPRVRSEQTSEDLTANGPARGGVPGALTNQPAAPGVLTPAGATAAPATAANPPAGANAQEGVNPQNVSRRATRNYELDKVISHSKLASGQLRRLSVAVVVDDKRAASEGGDVTRTARTPEEIERITALVREAVGFSAGRGDTVNVTNLSFVEAPAAEPLPEPPLWEQPVALDAGKAAVGVVLALLLFFGVLRPFFRSLVERTPAAGRAPLAALPGGMLPGRMGEDQLSLGGPAGIPQLAGPGGAMGGRPDSYEQQLAQARSMANQDPKRVAQVIKAWVSGDG